MEIRLAGARDGTAHALKARHEVPVVYITAHADRETIRARQAEGALRLRVEADCRRRSAQRRGDRDLQTRDETPRANQRGLLSATLQSIGEGVVATNPAGEIVFLNSAAEGLTGWSGKDAQGHLLMEPQRQEAAVHLAGAVAHDLNNQLRVILGNAELVEAPPGQFRSGATGSLVRHLITLSRSEPVHAEPLEWNALISGVKPLLAHTHLGTGKQRPSRPARRRDLCALIGPRCDRCC